MFVVASWVRLRSGKWDDYQHYFTERLVPATRELDGLRSLQLLKSADHPDEGFSLSFWSDRESWETYHDSELREELHREAEDLYTGEYWIKHSEVTFNSFPPSSYGPSQRYYARRPHDGTSR